MVQGAAGAALATLYPNDPVAVAAVKAANGGVIPNADGSIPSTATFIMNPMGTANKAAAPSATGTYLLIGGVALAGLIGVLALRKKKAS